MVSSIDFAKYLLSEAKNRQIYINLTKLMKLLYISDGILLSFGINAINENCRAWNYGPVYPNVYRWYSNIENRDFSVSESAKKEIEDNKYNNAITAALDKFGNWTASQLVSWTHKPSSPWEKALAKNDGKMNCIIDKNDIADYFRGIVNA